MHINIVAYICIEAQRPEVQQANIPDTTAAAPWSYFHVICA